MTSGSKGEQGTDAPDLVRVRADRVAAAGMILWAVALVVVLAVPTLRTGDRDWWPWACVSGLAVGALGWVYLRRGRGNAADADAPIRVPDAVRRVGER